MAMCLLALALLSAPAAADKPEPLEPAHPGLVRAQATERVKPIYPHEAILAGGPEARVLLRLAVEKSGKVSQYQVLESSLPGLGFEEAAAAMIESLRYRPAYLEGKKVRSYAYVEVSFSAPYRLCAEGEVPEPLLSPGEEARFNDGSKIDSEGGDRLPVIAHRLEPVYPDLPRRAGIEAVVDLAARISEDGNMSDSCIIESSQPNLGFEEASVDAVRQWRYEPALRRGEPVPQWVGIRVSFALMTPDR